MRRVQMFGWSIVPAGLVSLYGALRFLGWIRPDAAHMLTELQIDLIIALAFGFNIAMLIGLLLFVLGVRPIRIGDRIVFVARERVSDVHRQKESGHDDSETPEKGTG
jgi:hypothetical protein